MPALLSFTSYAPHSISAESYTAERLTSRREEGRATGDSWTRQATWSPSQTGFLDTENRLLLTRTEKLLPAIWRDWQLKQAHWQSSADATDALLRLGQLLHVVPLDATAVSAGFTYEQSLYVRAELPGAGGGTLYAEVNLGEDADAAEDTFVAIRQHRQEKWAISGPFASVWGHLQQHLNA
ncbi:hypothetical protein [uncultured Hymenobacter sp.]|uniref:hypothetical protein n=1 Tax=uncultured Hymenobacter sp. TaxID=170016 RepID=UPI0035CA5237